MKFVVVTYGTEGDTRPMALLCRALMDAGHEAHLLADAATLDCAARLNVSATALSGDIRSVLLQHSTLAARADGFGKAANAFARIATENSEAWLRTTMAVAQDCHAIVLGGLAAFVGISAAEALGIPAIGTGLIPITPTRAFASPFLRPGAVPHFLNRASHTLINGLIWRAFKSSINAARAAVCGLPARERLWSTQCFTGYLRAFCHHQRIGRRTRESAVNGWRPRQIGRHRKPCRSSWPPVNRPSMLASAAWAP